MSSKNTTGDKLVASIRKTKTGSADNSTVSTVAGDTVPKIKVAKKPAPRSKKKAAPVSSAKTAEASSSKAQLIDLFQYGQRVWPD
jgi:hypothetical protein